MERIQWSRTAPTFIHTDVYMRMYAIANVVLMCVCTIHINVYMCDLYIRLYIWHLHANAYG